MIRILLCLVLLFSAVCDAEAQTPFLPTAPASSSESEDENANASPASEEPSPNDLRELSRLLSDPAIAQWLKDAATDQGAGKQTVTSQTVTIENAIEQKLKGLSSRMGEITAAFRSLPTLPQDIQGVMDERLPRDRILRLTILIIIFVFVGIGTEWLYWCYVGHLRRKLELAHHDSFLSRLTAAVSRFVLTSCGAVFFALGAVGTFIAFDWPDFVREIVLDVLLLLVAMRFVSAIGLLVLAPNAPRLRLLPLERREAKSLFMGCLIIVFMIVGGETIVDILEVAGISEKTGLAAELVSWMTATLGAITIAWIVYSQSESGTSVAAPVLASITSIAVLLLAIAGLFNAALTLFIIMAAIYVHSLWQKGIRRSFALKQKALERERASLLATTSHEGNEPDEATATDVHGNEEQTNNIDKDGDDSAIYQPVYQRFVRAVVVITAIALIALTWGLSPEVIAAGDGISGKIIRALVDLTVVCIIGDLIWTATKAYVDKKMASLPKVEHGKAPGPEARMATLLPILKKGVIVVVVVTIFLVSLSSMGVNVAPLLAGAGVLGIAIGFGAQALVRDIVSGIFFLLDDAFRIGEYIEMGELRGTVESISIRSLRVRHHRGAVHTIPFGELKSLTNYSRDWVMMKLEFRVPFDTDLKQAKKIIKRLDVEFQAHPDYGHCFLQPLKFQGVRRMEEFNMVVGIKFMTKPGDQWTIRRDVYQRVRDEFDKAGITFAERNVKVEVIGGDPKDPEVQQKAVAAAQDAIEQQAGSGGAPAPA